MKAFHEHSKAMRADFVDDYARRLKDGELKGQRAKLDFVARFRAVLAEEEADWKRLQVSYAFSLIKTQPWRIMSIGRREWANGF